MYACATIRSFAGIRSTNASGALTTARTYREMTSMEPSQLIDTAWLFTRGEQSVRMLRVSDTVGRMHVIVHGPGAAAMGHHSDDLMESMLYQANLSRDLLRQGFQLNEATSDRRKGRERRQTPRGSADRRRGQPPPRERTPSGESAPA